MENITNIRCYYKNEDTMETAINLTILEAREHYLDKLFNIGFAEDSI